MTAPSCVTYGYMPIKQNYSYVLKYLADLFFRVGNMFLMVGSFVHKTKSSMFSREPFIFIKEQYINWSYVV